MPHVGNVWGRKGERKDLRKAVGTVALRSRWYCNIRRQDNKNSWKTAISTTVYSFVSKKKSNIKLENWLVGY